jgi:hypothetical protein
LHNKLPGGNRRCLTLLKLPAAGRLVTLLSII